MIRPWQVWAMFALSLLVVLPAMGWLTVKVMESEKAELLAAQQMELEQIIGRSLWRMDTRLTPILAVEAARPTFVYQPFLAQDVSGVGKKKAAPKPSPLLTEPSEFVLLNFQLSTNDEWISPQCVPTDQQALATQLGCSPDRLKLGETRLAELKKQVCYTDLVAMLPKESLVEMVADAPTTPTSQTVAANSDYPQQAEQNTLIFNQGLNNGNRFQNGRATRSQTPNQSLTQNPNADNDLASRNNTFQNYAQRERREQQQAMEADPLRPALAREGVSVPLWVNSQLLLVRRVMIGERTIVQGCWLDWPKMQATLLNEVRDLLPDVRLEQVSSSSDVQLGHMLATLPVQLVVAAPQPIAAALSPLRISLGVAWGTLLLAAAAIMLLLQGVVTLSERRGAFVSAVTHELRTPLTTFRMYAEMLAEGMVPDEERRQQYLQTLRIEADRLSHLVENVLQYARLERGRPGHRREAVTVEQLLSRFASRLSDRATQAELQFVVEADEAIRSQSLHTDPAAAEQILFNLVDNACKYATTATDRRLHLSIETSGTEIVFIIHDHGPGIEAKIARRLFRPFSKSVTEAAHSAPGVGLGLALSRRLAKDLGGSLKLVSSKDVGACFELRLPK